MQRPGGVTAIGCFFLLAGVYLCSISATMLIVPNAIPTLRVAPFVRQLRLLSPYATLAIGVLWASVAWGLFQLRDWARWAAQLVLAIGVASFIPMLFVSRFHSGWRLLAACLEIFVRVAAVCYLFTPKVLDVFTAKRSHPSSVTPAGPVR